MCTSSYRFVYIYVWRRSLSEACASDCTAEHRSLPHRCILADLLSGCYHIVVRLSSSYKTPDCACIFVARFTTSDLHASTVESSRRSSKYRDFQIPKKGGQSNRSDEVICRFHIQAPQIVVRHFLSFVFKNLFFFSLIYFLILRLNLSRRKKEIL